MAKTNPKDVDPAKPDPANTDPAKPDPADSDPAKPDPADSDPADSDPADSDPADSDPEEGKNRCSPLATSLLHFVTIIVIAAIMLFGIKLYKEALVQKRVTIIRTVEVKGIKLKDPEMQARYEAIFRTNWLPSLVDFLEEIRKTPRNFDMFADNPEEGSYIDYIERHNMPFDGKDAVEWHTRSIRKPIP